MEFPNSQLFSLLDYPRGEVRVGEKRYNLLRSYGVKNLRFVARGYRGVVFRGEFSGKPVAVKVPRSDAGKDNVVEKECSILRYLKSCLKEENPAPEPYICTPDFIVMEWIEGIPFPVAVENFGKEVVLSALKSCYLLDTCGVEHSEIKGEKHLLFDGKRVRIIDFESAKLKKKPRNLLQFVGYHLLRKKEVLKVFRVDERELLSLLSDYKENPETAFPKILSLFDK